MEKKLPVILKQNAYKILQHSSAQLNKCVNKNKQTFHSSTVTILIGHNASAFDTPTLLHSAPSTFCESLKSLGIVFADNKLGTLYASLFKEFNAHDALEDVKALTKILFHSLLQVPVQQILEHRRTQV